MGVLTVRGSTGFSLCPARAARALFVTAVVAAAAAASPPQRIIAASPDIAEILYGVGAFDHVVAVSEYSNYPPAVKSLPRVGRWEDTNLEAIVSLHADLVMFAAAQAPFIESHLRDLGIPYLAVPGATLADVFTAIDMIGRATGHEAEARQLAAHVHARLDAVRVRTRGLPVRRTLLIVDRTPGTLRDLYAVTKGSFLAELIEIAGGTCVGTPAPKGYTKISKEAVMDLAPDAIIDFVHGSTTRMGEDPQKVWRDLPELAAVRDRHVYPVRDDFLPHPSQFVADTAELFARLLHPEAAH